MRRWVNTIIYLLITLAGYGQLYDANWVAGDTPLSFMDADSDNVVIDSMSNYNLLFTFTAANICDENGNLLYITNGISIFDKNGDTLQNGTGINPCDYTKQHACCGLNIPQAALFIPLPGNNRYYYLFHFSNDNADSSRPATIYYSMIDKQGNGGLGAVIQKNDTLFHTMILRGGGMAACKHANGRDYWLIMGASVINTFYKFLITPDGVRGPFTQSIGPEFPGAFDNAYSRFSQDGSKFVTGVGEGPVLVMDFDRCSGEFSNPVSIFNLACFPPASPCSGSSSVEFSPDNRFLYVADVINLNQYDLWSTNIQDSAVEIDSINSTQIAQLNMLLLAHNGKIYLSSWDGLLTYDSLHVINNPDAKGDSCNFKYASQPTYSTNNIVPNMANYRLGALVGSGCDTITAIINDPVVEKSDIRVYPNPAKNLLNLAYYAQTTGLVQFELTDELGQTVMLQSLGAAQTYAQYETGSLSSGLYYWRLKDSTRTIKAGKVVIMR